MPLIDAHHSLRCAGARASYGCETPAAHHQRRHWPNLWPGGIRLQGRMHQALPGQAPQGGWLQRLRLQIQMGQCRPSPWRCKIHPHSLPFAHAQIAAVLKCSNPLPKLWPESHDDDDIWGLCVHIPVATDWYGLGRVVGDNRLSCVRADGLRLM